MLLLSQDIPVPPKSVSIQLVNCPIKKTPARGSFQCLSTVRLLCLVVTLVFYFKRLSAFHCCLTTASSNSRVFCKFKALHILKFPMPVWWASIGCKPWRNFSSIQFYSENAVSGPLQNFFLRERLNQSFFINMVIFKILNIQNIIC